MKRIFCILLAVCMLLTLGGCGAPPASQEGDTITWSSDDYKNAELMARKIVSCLVNQDREGLSALFCQSIRGQSSYLSAVGSLFDMFRYDSYIGYRYDDIRSTTSNEGDKEVFKKLQAEIIYIEVPVPGKDDTRFYGLEWHWVLTCEDDPSLLGIHQLTIRLLNTEQSVTVGNLNYLP